jgi:hypothetical protein
VSAGEGSILRKDDIELSLPMKNRLTWVDLANLLIRLLHVDNLGIIIVTNHGLTK